MAFLDKLKETAKNKFSSYTNAAYARKESIKKLPLNPDPNVLHKFASYNTIFTLSALNRTELRNPKQFFQSAPHDIIAQSGGIDATRNYSCLLYTSPSPRDYAASRMPSSA